MAAAASAVGRPPVSVILPFRGDAAEAAAALDALDRLELKAEDEILVADNTDDGLVESLAASHEQRISIVAARDERSAYYARNVAAERAGCDWLLFLDADCLPPPALAELYFSEPIEADVGAIAGPIAPAAQPGLLPRWAASREVLSQERSMALPAGPAAATANLLVRRRAWAELGGFLEGASLGTEFEFCWRLADAGWRLEYRAAARVEHLHRESLRAVLRQFSMYAAGDAWLNRRRPGSVPRPRLLAPLARCLAGIGGFAITGRFDRARMKAVDALVIGSQAIGYLRGNAAPRRPPAPGHRAGPVVFTDIFPVLTEQFVPRELAAFEAAGRRVRVEAVARPDRPLEGGARGLEVNWLEDEGTLDRIRALAWLIVRHPVRSARDVDERRRLDAAERMPLRALAPSARRLASHGERHVHVHFAALAAANALRVGRLGGASVSITPHAHEIYAEPRSLPAKLERADLVTTVCEYNARHLRELAGADAAPIVSLPLGIDLERHRRSLPRAHGRTVVAVGRLVEQKGFRDLVEAVALLEADEPLERAVIAGAGPLRGELEQLAERLGVTERVELVGPLDPAATGELIERADLLAMPSVIAADGNRDAIPVVVLEALALEVPVVASDEVGLPEVVRPQWGRLVPAADPRALAAAIAELLALPAAERARMGAAGREFIASSHDLDRQAQALLEMIEDRSSGAPPAQTQSISLR